jgi:lipoprotein signal peptidase
MASGKIENSLYWIAAILGLVLDQASKYLAVQYLKQPKSIAVIDGIYISPMPPTLAQPSASLAVKSTG